MSSSSPCPCQANWPADCQGHHRDPINNEKSWLDFVVRFLSREAVGKGRGQETVWNVSCKPSWWNEVGLPWKNPTSNPKDSKEALLQKYEALEYHLRQEGRFPVELEEEAWLWGEGKYKELFLLTALKSLLGKVTSTHSAVIEASIKAEDMKAEINQSLMNKIETCLSSTLSSIENIKASRKPDLKRSNVHLGKENSHEIKEKLSKTDSVAKKLKPILPSVCKPTPMQVPSNKSSSFSTKSTEHARQKVLSKRKTQKPSKQAHRDVSMPSSSTNPKKCVGPSAIAAPLQSMPSSATPLVIQVSQEEFDKLLQGNIFTLPCQSQLPTSTVNCLSSSENNNVQNHSPDLPQTDTCHHPTITNDSVVENVPTLTDFNQIPLNKSPPCSDGDDTFRSPLSFNSMDVLLPLSTEIGNPQISLSEPLPSYVCSPTNSAHSDNSLGSALSNSSTEHEISLNINGVCSTVNTLPSLHSQGDRLPFRDSHHISPTPTDAGYGSDEGPMLDLDSLFSPDEQTKLWEEDGSYLLDRFLDGLI